MKFNRKLLSGMRAYCRNEGHIESSHKATTLLKLFEAAEGFDRRRIDADGL